VTARKFPSWTSPGRFRWPAPTTTRGSSAPAAPRSPSDATFERVFAVDHPYTLGAARSMLAFLYMVRGELGHAIRLLERELAVPPEGSVAHWVVNAGHLGYAYTLSGRTAEGIPLQERALKVIETIKLGAYQPTCMIQLGEAYLLADRLEDALDLAQRALTFTRERGQPCRRVLP
jgi:tetratricopeptide (TPR) repeat protein